MGKMPFNEFQQSATGRALAQSMSVEQQIQRQRQYFEEIKPLVQMQANILSLQPVRYVISETAFMEKEIMWDANSKSMFHMLDEHIKSIGCRLGFVVP